MADYNSSLPIRTEADGDVVAQIAGSTVANIWDVDANGIGQVNLNDGTNALVIGASGELTAALASGSEVQITDGTDTLLVNTDGTIGIGDGTEQLLINTDGSILTQITDGTNALVIGSNGEVTSLISDGTDSLAINTDGSLNVNIISSSISATEYHQYGTTSAGVPGTPSTVISHTTTALKTFILKQLGASGSGKCKVEVKTGTPSSETTKLVFFLSSSDNNQEITFAQPIEVAAGDNTLVVMTNRDNANADLYAFINGNEV
jgi:hypothetical protein